LNTSQIRISSPCQTFYMLIKMSPILYPHLFTFTTKFNAYHFKNPPFYPKKHFLIIAFQP